jgi:hypothetical protein
MLLGILAMSSVVAASQSLEGGPPPGVRGPIGVRDAIETTRILGGAPWGAAREGANPISESPRRTRYATLLVRGDVARNGNWLTVIVGRLDSLADAVRYEELGKLFQTGLGSADSLDHTLVSLPGGNTIQWLGEDRFVFCWNDDQGVIQVFQADIGARTLTQLTHSSTDIVVHTVIARRDGTLVFASRTDHGHTDRRSRELLASGFVVTNDDAFSVVQKRLDGLSALTRAWDVDWYIQRGQDAPTELNLSGRPHVPREPWTAVLSPDGRYAILSDAPRDIPNTWRSYSNPMIRRGVTEWFDISRDATFAKCIATLYLLEFDTGHTRPIWPVPSIASLKPTVFWAPDSRSFVVGPTALPLPTSDEAGISSNALVEVDAATGSFRRIPFDADYTRDWTANSVRWLSHDSIVVRTTVAERLFRRLNGVWKESSERSKRPAKPRIALQVREDLNIPPRIYAVDYRLDREALVLDPNPGLEDRFRLARVEEVDWTVQGQLWKGLLYLPRDYDGETRLPLVVQTHGVLPYPRFSLYGNIYSGLSTGTGVHVAQLLASRGIAVAQFSDLPSTYSGGKIGPASEAEASMGGYEAGVRELVRRGIVDESRVGLLGFSRTGWLVQYTLSHSKFPFAAALTSDNISGGYLEATLWTAGVMEEENGGPPFGAALQSWLKQAPPFNAEFISTPLRLVQQTGPIEYVLTQWELFSRLRRLRKPVELYVIPDIDHGDHALQNPLQVLSLQQGTIDWFRFWLQDFEDHDMNKTEQYRRWRELRDLRDADVRRGQRSD